MKAINLKTEYLTNPIGIDYRLPRLSWNCESGKKQTAYQIVAVDVDGTELWDSGKVESSQMHLIPWGASALSSRDRVLWTVRLWDENDMLGEMSEEATFELGLLSPSDWKSHWITGNYKVDKKKRYPVDCFRKIFAISEKKTVKAARAYMTACGIYEGQLNGDKIGRFCLAPGHTDYRKRVQYQTVDITSQIRSGSNELLFMLADGWYRGSVGAWGLKNFYGSQTKLLAQIEIEYSDGTVDTICTDDSFEWTNGGPIRFADNKDGEIYDARLEDFTNANWSNARIASHNVVPTASNNFLLTEHEVFTKPQLIITPSGERVLDFGQNIAGYVEFAVTAKAGQRVFMRFGEKLDDKGEFTQKNIQCVKKDYVTPLQQIEYFCKDGDNHYKTRFAIFGFQYVLVESDVEIAPENIKAIAVYSDFERTFYFESSNQLLNKFVENTLWSLKNNSADIPTDCPTRERHGWSGDAQIFVNTASYMVNYAPFANKYEIDLCDLQRKNGAFTQIAPEGGTDFYMKAMDGSVGWADAGIMIPYRMWKKYGDVRFIEKYYENMKKYAMFVINRCGKNSILMSEKVKISKENKKYLYNVGQHYGEWAEPSDIHEMSYKDFSKSKPEEATAYTSYVMSLMAEIAIELGHADDAKLFVEYAQGCKKAYQELVENDSFSLDTNRQARLVRPLYFDLLDEKKREYAKSRLIKALDDYDWRVGTGFLSTPLILYVLQQIDLEYAYKLLENEKKPGWLYMPLVGATTIWEDWDGPSSDNGVGGGIASLNHYSKGAVCEWVFDEMCGVKVAGENHFIISPQPGGSFTHASFSYDSVYGKVSCSWRKQAAGKYTYHILIPPNTTADIRLPEKDSYIVDSGTYII